jgi:hypothetical protein
MSQNENSCKIEDSISNTMKRVKLHIVSVKMIYSLSVDKTSTNTEIPQFKQVAIQKRICKFLLGIQNIFSQKHKVICHGKY